MSGATKAGIGGLAGVIIACLMAWLSGGDVFQAFQQASLQSQGTAPKGFRGTYWNYLIYTAI